ncbi:MAG: GntR family transcriptional regulator [Bacteroidetes bacterium]|nr:GntR family transcriptional regulator [Bacteroidota bacterium]MBU1677247.1 GntR family transcriptional regulator [Bacteroidota bacterium]
MTFKINHSDPTPLYKQIEREILQKISSHELKPGELLGSNKILSIKFNVSLITIKKAVANLIKDGTLYSRVGIGTYVAEKKKNIVERSNHKTLGLVLRNLRHPFFSMIFDSLEEKAYQLGYNLLLSSSSNDVDREESQIEHFVKIGVDGLIIASLSQQYYGTPYLDQLNKQNFPYVMFSYIHNPDYWYIGSNHEFGGYLAGKHFVEMGYENIGFLNAGPNNLLGTQRLEGMKRALKEFSIPFLEKFVFNLEKEEYDKDRYDAGLKFGKYFLELKNRPEALFIYSDSASIGFERAVLESGLQIPKDIAIIGFDDIIAANYAPVPLTTIHQPVDKIGSLAVEIVHNRINSQPVGKRTILKPHLVIRDSCGHKK